MSDKPPHPSPQTCIAEAARARAQALHFADMSQRSDAVAAQRRRSWLNALRCRADAEMWQRAADAVQRWRMAL